MVFQVNSDGVDSLESRTFESLDFKEKDIEEWIIETPSLLGGKLLIISSQHKKFDRTGDTPDILALDPEGKLVVIELKRDRADSTTDLQALKYANYCSTISAEALQQEYRAFWNERRSADDQLTPEEVGNEFREFLGDGIATVGEGYAEFTLDDRPRMLLLAGSFDPEITTPVVWLERAFGMDIACVELEAYHQDEDVFISSMRVLPIEQAEEYMAKRREKERQQGGSTDRSGRAINVLLDAGLVEQDDIVMFNQEKLPDGADRQYNANDEFWRGRITGKTGRNNDVEWLENGLRYSFTALAQEVLKRATGREFNVNGYPYWRHQEHGITLTELRRTEAGNIDW